MTEELITKLKKYNLIIVCGLPFSGKTVISKDLSTRLNAERVSFDETWNRLEQEITADESKKTLDWETVRSLCKDLIKSNLTANKNTIYDDVNATFQMRQEIAQIARSLGLTYCVLYLDISLDEMYLRIKRNIKEKYHHQVSKENLQNVVQGFEEPSLNEVVVIYPV